MQLAGSLGHCSAAAAWSPPCLSAFSLPGLLRPPQHPTWPSPAALGSGIPAGGVSPPPAGSRGGCGRAEAVEVTGWRWGVGAVVRGAGGTAGVGVRRWGTRPGCRPAPPGPRHGCGPPWRGDYPRSCTRGLRLTSSQRGDSAGAGSAAPRRGPRGEGPAGRLAGMRERVWLCC